MSKKNNQESGKKNNGRRPRPMSLSTRQKLDLAQRIGGKVFNVFQEQKVIVSEDDIDFIMDVASELVKAGARCDLKEDGIESFKKEAQAILQAKGVEDMLASSTKKNFETACQKIDEAFYQVNMMEVQLAKAENREISLTYLKRMAKRITIAHFKNIKDIDLADLKVEVIKRGKKKDEYALRITAKAIG